MRDTNAYHRGVTPAAALSGFLQDSGGLTAAGELPEAPPIWVESARDLKAEIDTLVMALDEKQEWTKRIDVCIPRPPPRPLGFCCCTVMRKLAAALQRGKSVQLAASAIVYDRVRSLW